MTTQGCENAKRHGLSGPQLNRPTTTDDMLLETTKKSTGKELGTIGELSEMTNNRTDKNNYIPKQCYRVS